MDARSSVCIVIFRLPVCTNINSIGGKRTKEILELEKVTTHYRVDEERLVTDGSSVTISNVGLDDEGTYKCILDFKTDPSINEEFTTVVVRIKERV